MEVLIIHRAQYQPRPKRYSQHLGLAVSIISDLRMDRSKNTKLWGLDSKNEDSVHDWTPDEVRAVAGTYYLASRLVASPLLETLANNFLKRVCSFAEISKFWVQALLLTTM